MLHCGRNRLRSRSEGRRARLYLGGAPTADDSRSGGALPLRPVEFDRRLMVAALVAAFLFLWPLLVYGHPGYIQDSAAYYKGGRAAVTYVFDKIEHRNA